VLPGEFPEDEGDDYLFQRTFAEDELPIFGTSKAGRADVVSTVFRHLGGYRCREARLEFGD
jgi:hypothetical protein